MSVNLWVSGTVARTAAFEHRYSVSVVCMALLLKVNTRVRT